MSYSFLRAIGTDRKFCGGPASRSPEQNPGGGGPHAVRCVPQSVLTTRVLTRVAVLLFMTLPWHASGQEPQDQQRAQRANENLQWTLGVKHYRSALFLGFSWSQEDVSQFAPYRLGLPNPWTRKPFENVFAFGVNRNNPLAPVLEVLRVVGENLNRSQAPVGASSADLKDAYIDTLVAHSNGCDGALTLIKLKWIHVRKLVLLAPPFGTRLEAKRLLNGGVVQELEMYSVAGDIVAEKTGKAIVPGVPFLLRFIDVEFGIWPGRQDEAVVGLRFTWPLGGSATKGQLLHDVTFRNEESQILSKSHWILTILMDCVIYRGDADLIRQYLAKLDDIYADAPESEREQLKEDARQKLQRALLTAQGKEKTAAHTARPAVRSPTDASVGVEAGPVSAAMIAFWMAAAAQLAERPMSLDDLLPTDAIPTAKPVVSRPQQTMLSEFRANAVDARAVDFRVDGSTVGVVLVTKTLREPYFHDYHVCPRFHGWGLDDLAAVPLSMRGDQASSSESGWFWLCRIYDDRSGMAEVGSQFVVLVNESRREMTIDSRWLSKQYCHYWRGERAGAYDYFLNFQVWSSSESETCYLVEAVLAKLAQLSGGNWKLILANQEEPRPPVVFLEGAWLTGNVVQVTAWNRLWTPCFAVFHGTKQSVRDGDDVSFEHWVALRPGRNVLQLPLGQIDNAVVHCEVDGFIDKVFVSVDKTRTKPLPPVPTFAGLGGQPHAAKPQVKIAWPPSNARVVVLRDQLDMLDNDDGKRLAINGTVAGALPGSTIDVFVYTDRWYKQDSVVTQDGLWGARIRLSGQGPFNKHSIYVRLRDANGTEIAHDRVDGIVRIDPFTAAPTQAAVSQPYPRPEPAHEWDRILVEAKDFQAHGGCYREAKGGLIVGGGPDGPYSGGGSASCRLTLPEDASAIKLRMSIWHGMETEFGKGVHSVRPGGTVTVYVNDIPVHTIVCRYRGMYGDFWPEKQPELGRQLPEIGLGPKGIKGRLLRVKVVASPGTCMDLRSIAVEPMSQ